MKAEGKGYEQDTDYKEVGVLEQGELSLSPTKLTNSLGDMSIPFVENSRYREQDSEDNWSRG